MLILCTKSYIILGQSENKCILTDFSFPFGSGKFEGSSALLMIHQH